MLIQIVCIIIIIIIILLLLLLLLLFAISLFEMKQRYDLEPVSVGRLVELRTHRYLWSYSSRCFG